MSDTSETRRRREFTRRSFLALPFVAPMAVMARSATGSRNEHWFAHDHLLGTSLDLVVWTDDAREAARAETAALAEVRRLTAILSTYDPASEISQLQTAPAFRPQSRELVEVLATYETWRRRTRGAISARATGTGRLNVDALGKAYIVDRALAAARLAAPQARGILLNIGGDVASFGRMVTLDVANPSEPFDNARPITRVAARDAAVATSGRYARGSHLVDPRTGRPATGAHAATVMAPTCVTANALATAACVLDAGETLELVHAVPGARALLVTADGALVRSAGFGAVERPLPVRTAADTNWPAGYAVSIALTITTGGSNGGFGGFRGFGRGRGRRPYVAVWVEDGNGKLVRVLVLWGSKWRYLTDMPGILNAIGRDQNLLYSVSRATRDPGHYDLIWDGLDDHGKAVPNGTYRIVVEVNQEHGNYAKQAGTIACGNEPATATLRATVDFEAVEIAYGPRATS